MIHYPKALYKSPDDVVHVNDEESEQDARANGYVDWADVSHAEVGQPAEIKATERLDVITDEEHHAKVSELEAEIAALNAEKVEGMAEIQSLNAEIDALNLAVENLRAQLAEVTKPEAAAPDGTTKGSK